MMGKRIWSLMLSVLLVMTMVPASVVTAFAEDAFTAATSPAAEDAVQNREEVVYEPADEPADEPAAELTDEPTDESTHQEPEETALVAYTISYLLVGTEDQVPGLESVEGEAAAGQIISIEWPEMEGYLVCANQPTQLTIPVDPGQGDTVDAVVFYEKSKPEQTLSVTVDGIVFTVHAPAGTLPGGSFVSAVPMSPEAVTDAVDAILGEDRAIIEMIVYDVTIRDAQGNEIQPDGDVYVTVANVPLAADEGQALEVFHIDANSGAAERKAAIAADGSAGFAMDGFSPVALILSATAPTSVKQVTVQVGKSTELKPGKSGDGYKWTTSDNKVVRLSNSNRNKVTVNGDKPGTATVTYTQGGTTETWLVTVAATVTFHLNGGSGIVPGSLNFTGGQPVNLPNGAGLTRANHEFCGWSTSQTPYTVNENASMATVYEPGAPYTPNGNTTLYAVWVQTTGTQKGEITIAIRKDGKVPAEPAIISDQVYDFLVSEKSVSNVLTYFNPAKTTTGVGAVKGSLTAAFHTYVETLRGSRWNPATHYVEWYVIKYQANDGVWHIDGAIREKSKVSLDYEPNAVNYENKDLGPTGGQHTPETTVRVADTGWTRTGYNFTGWNTVADGSGTAYAVGSSIKLNENTTLYAQWKMDENSLKELSYTIQYYKDGNLDATEVIKREVWIGSAETTLDVKAIDQNKYPGYVFESTNPSPLPGKTPTGSTIQVYYVSLKQVSFAAAGNGSLAAGSVTYQVKAGHALSSVAGFANPIPTPAAATATVKYEFEKWTKNGVDFSTNANYDFSTFTGENTNIAFVAHFKAINLYTVTFAVEGGSATLVGQSAFSSLPHGSTWGNQITVPTLNYDQETVWFAGWYETTDGMNTKVESMPGSNTVITGSRSFVARFEAKPAITLQAASLTKVYDGAAATAPTLVSVPTMKPGHVLTYTVAADKTVVNVADSPAVNKVTSWDIQNAAGVSVKDQYQVVTKNGALTITPRPVTITAGDNSKVYGAADPGFTFTVTPAGALVDPVHLGTISVSRSNSTVQAADTYTGVLVPSYTPNSNYAVTPVNGDFTIHEANAPAITVTGYQGIYDGQPRSVTVGGTQPGDKVEYKVGAEGIWTETPPSQINTTDVTVFIRVTRPNHYVFEGDVKLIITPRPVTFIVGNAVKMYGTPDPTNISYYLALGSLRVVKGDDLKLKPLVKNADQNAGVHKEALDLSYDNPHGNYQIIVKPGTLTITRRPVIIIAHDSSKTHGAVDPTFNYTVIPKNALVDPADLGVISVSRSNSSVEAVGTYTGVLVPSYTANSNYVVIPVNGNFTITEGTVAAQLALGNYAGEYDGQPHGIAILDGVDAEKDQVLYSESPDGPWDPAPVTRTNKTETPVTVYVQVTRAGYKARTGSATITITPRPVTFTVDDAVKMYGTPDPANLTYRLAIGSLAVVGGDNLNLEPFSMNWDQNVGNHEEVLGLSYNDPTGNYDITVNRGALTITPRPLTIATGSRSTTGGSTTRLTYNSWSITAGSVAEGDSLAVSVTGEQVGRGSSPNTATALITTTRLIPMRIAAEADVTANYAIQYSFGTLTISRPTGGGGGGGDDGGGTITIIDDPTPLGAGGTILILDGQVPLGALPKTGSQLGKAASRAGLASLVLGSLLHGLSKKKKNEQDQ